VRRLSAVVAAAVVAGGGLALTTHGAHAAAISCSNSSLIAAITTANKASTAVTVTLPSGCTFNLTAANNATDGGTALPVITGKVTITGNGATIERSTATGTPVFRIFDVASAGHLTLDSVVLSNGLANNGQNGGGAINSHGTLVISGSTFSGNQSPSSSGTSGGAIASSGPLTVTASTFSGNLAMEGGALFIENTATITKTTFTSNTATIYGGGGIVSAAGTTTVKQSTFVGNSGPGGGAIDNDATINVSNSTFYQNTGGNNGGGAIQNFGTTTVSQSTLSANASPYGADLHNYGTSILKVSASIVANGVSGDNCSGAPITDGGYNLDTGTSCGFSAANHSMSTTQPELDALASNGGSTQTLAIPAASPAVNAIPTSVSGCTGTTDQRGTARPQGTGCDIGAYEVITSSGDTQPPTTPTGLTATSVTSNAVTLTWKKSTDNVGVTGYTIYRNGTAVGSTGGAAATTFTDATAAPSTVYSYAVDAFDASGNHSPLSASIPVTTPAPSGIKFVQGGAVSTGSRVTHATIPLSGQVSAGDLLVGWFGQYDASGPVQVSDNVNGAWTRSTSTTFSSGGGDIALYYVQNAAASQYGVTVTIAAAGATYLEGAAADYNGVATSAALDQVTVGNGVGTAVDTGSTSSVAAGELVVGAILTGGSPGSVTPGASQGVMLSLRAQTGSGSADLADILAGAAGAQDAVATLGASTDWYAVTAVFHRFG
jgi:chitodextrinase